MYGGTPCKLVVFIGKGNADFAQTGFEMHNVYGEPSVKDKMDLN